MSILRKCVFFLLTKKLKKRFCMLFLAADEKKQTKQEKNCNNNISKWSKQHQKHLIRLTNTIIEHYNGNIAKQFVSATFSILVILILVWSNRNSVSRGSFFYFVRVFQREETNTDKKRKKTAVYALWLSNR